MITNSTPTNEAILSNVGETGEFKIRNSQKAFGILSSGLYANKIRAIVRELSTNARDSHVEAGKADVPFDLHLPTDLEPWFAIRDYGTGLDHSQVIDIMTVYFESTKTNSNDFIGTLGLGSKSPFSFTDNFTVTAIKDHMKRIYTAFINDQGVPSVALMFEDETNEPNGVEIRFGVEDRWDSRKFADEASSVFAYFDVKPNLTGGTCVFQDYKYTDVDVVPGVSVFDHCKKAVAVMGSIEYPIEVPNAKSNLGTLAGLLEYPLELRFDIGELDIQASREGLSYIPLTVESIRKKLSAFNDALADVVAKEADKIENEWERALFLEDKTSKSRMWEPAVAQYLKLTGFDLCSTKGFGCSTTSFDLDEYDIAETYNIKVGAFEYRRGTLAASTLKASKRRDPSDYTKNVYTWHFPIDKRVHFVVNDTKIGATERAKYHWKQNTSEYRSEVFVLSPADKTKSMDTEAFFEFLRNPPSITKVTSLDEKPRKSTERSDATVSILRLESTHSFRRNSAHVWRDAGTLATMDNDTKYYLPLSGYSLDSKYGDYDAKNLAIQILTSKLLGKVQTIYGVRKSDIENIKKHPNWVNVEDYFVEQTKTINYKFVRGVARDKLADRGIVVGYAKSVTNLLEDKNSKFRKIAEELAGVDIIQVFHMTDRAIYSLMKRYSDHGVVNPLEEAGKLADECEAVLQDYPMLKYVDSRNINPVTVAEYVNMVDQINSNKV